MVEKAFALCVEAKVMLVKDSYLPVDLTAGGVEQHMFVGKWKEVRTLPHFASVDGVSHRASIPGSLREGMQVLPVAAVGGAIEQHCTADLGEAGTDAQVPDVTVFPWARIAESSHVQPGRRALKYGFVELFPCAQVRIG